MNAREIVVHNVEGDGRFAILDFLEKAFVSRVNRRIPIRIEKTPLPNIARVVRLSGRSSRPTQAIIAEPELDRRAPVW